MRGFTRRSLSDIHSKVKGISLLALIRAVFGVIDGKCIMKPSCNLPTCIFPITK